MKSRYLKYYISFSVVLAINVAWAVLLGTVWDDIECSTATAISSVLVWILLSCAALLIWKKKFSRKLWKTVFPISIILIALIVSFVVVVPTGNTLIFQGEKPVIYLYPENGSQISVEVELKNGKITESIPAYQNGWNVFVSKNGMIGDKYDYLFYETKISTIELPESGWVVEGASIERWFDKKLPELGLIENEIEDFKAYWLNRLPKSNFYEIKLLTDDYLNEHWGLNVIPEPDTMIRLMFYFRPVSNQDDLPKPITNTPSRQGFTVIEWGGIVDD